VFSSEYLQDGSAATRDSGLSPSPSLPSSPTKYRNIKLLNPGKLGTKIRYKNGFGQILFQN